MLSFMNINFTQSMAELSQMIVVILEKIHMLILTDKIHFKVGIIV